MNILIFIPARAGSKRLKNKNLRKVGGKALWQIACETGLEVAKKLKEQGHVTGVAVSTDIPEIIGMGYKCKANGRWALRLRDTKACLHKRPRKLAGETASIYDAIHHCVDTMLPKSKTPDAVIILQPTSPLRTVKNVMEAWKLFEIEKRDIVSINSNTGEINGAVYIYKYGARGGIKKLFCMDAHSSVDINTLADLRKARQYWKERNR